MRIGIYNRWLATLGGGERYTLDLAHVLLNNGHAVELITHAPLDQAALDARMGTLNPAITLRAVPDSPHHERVSAASGAYDLFINASHGDLVPARAARNVLVVYFPLPPASYTEGGAVELDGRSAFAAPSGIAWLHGVYGLEQGNNQTWAWTGSRAVIEVTRRWPTPAHLLQIDLADVLPPTLPPPAVQVRVNGDSIAARRVRWTRWAIPLPQPVRRSETATVEIEAAPWTLRAAGLAPDDRERGVALGNVALFGSFAEARMAARVFDPSWHAITPTPRSVELAQQALDSYASILAISQFTQEWITRRWDRSSDVLYPAVALDVPAVPKQHQILSVGRFFPGSHNKQHVPMIQAFRALCDAGLRGWEYHLVGGCDEAVPEHRAYLDQVRAAAAGYPITLHVNVAAADVARRYGAGSIFWHATGYGEDEERAPERFEHFGITTVEAMHAGCVPVVINKAGQRETVEHGESGLLWITLDELQAHTQRIIADAGLRQRLAHGAQERSQWFDLEHFAERVQILVLDRM